MTETGTETIDWQHPEVQKRLLGQVLYITENWRAEHGRIGRLQADRSDLHAALVFVGCEADAFQIARFLEDSRLWPANQALVIALKDVRTVRDSIIEQIHEERNPKPVWNKGDPFPVGFQFKAFDGAKTPDTFVVLSSRKLYDDFALYYTVRNMRTNEVHDDIAQRSIERWVDEFGPVDDNF